MKLFVASALSLVLAAGCSRPVSPRAAADEPSTPEKIAIALPKKAPAESAGRKPGDYVVFRFSGSYREAPVEMVQRVIARRGDVLIVDVSVEGRPAFRLEVDDRPDTRGSILEVARLVNGVAEPIETSAYEALLGDLIVLADDNEGLVDDEEVKLSLGDTTLVATKLTYRVRVGGRAGFMSTYASEGFAWGDAGGEIRTATGEVLYKAEIVDVGHEAGTSVAASEPYEALEGLDHLDQ
jgi:hypothetical protein